MVQNTRRSNEKIQKLSITAVLTALIIVMSFTFIGYLKIGVVSITFIPIPVTIGSIICGPAVGALLGAVFGITSLVQCFGMDAFGTALMSVSPLYTVILCIVPRVLMGLFSGLIYKAMSKTKAKKGLIYGISSFSGGFLNTAFFTLFLIALFYNTGELYNLNIGGSVLAIITTFITMNSLIEWAACIVIGSAVSAAVTKALSRR